MTQSEIKETVLLALVTAAESLEKNDWDTARSMVAQSRELLRSQAWGKFS